MKPYKYIVVKNLRTGQAIITEREGQVVYAFEKIIAQSNRVDFLKKRFPTATISDRVRI